MKILITGSSGFIGFHVSKLLLEKGFFYMQKGRDKRIKQYYPSKDLERHMRATWEVRIKQIEAILKMSSKYEEVLEFLKKDKYVW